MVTDNEYIHERSRILGKSSGPGHGLQSRELIASKISLIEIFIMVDYIHLQHF
jgi:hypothetical protein